MLLRYFAHVFGSLDPEDETVVLRHGKVGDGSEDLAPAAFAANGAADPLAQITYATMRTVVDFLETGNGLVPKASSLKVGEQNVRQLLLASDTLAIAAVENACFNYLKARHFNIVQELSIPY